MIWLSGLEPLQPGCATDCDLKILSVLYKSKQLVPETKCFHVFHVMITDEIPVTILQAYMSLPRHIHKGVLIRRNIASDLHAAAVANNFAKKLRKRLRRKMFERNYSFFYHCLLSCGCVLFQKHYIE